MTGRLESLDVLRGFDMMFIMGGGALIASIASAFGCGWLAQQMQHPLWDGLTQHDTIFPLFLFIAGVSWPYSLAKRRECGLGDCAIAFGCFRRAAVLFVLGLVYGGLLQGTLRIGSVLGRIGIAWMVAAWLYMKFKPGVRLAIALALLVGYWALILFVPAPDAATVAFPAGCEGVGRGPLSPVGNLSGWFDRHFAPGILGGFPGVMDNQSILGYIPAVATATFGMLSGEYIRSGKGSGGRKTLVLLLVAALMLLLGFVWARGLGAFSMPINKKLWSSSFTLVVGGYSVGMLAAFYWLIDVRGWWRRTLFFRVIGLNAITIYLLQRFVPFGTVSKEVFGGLAELLPGVWQGVALKAGYLALCWLVLYFLFKKDVYLKV